MITEMGLERHLSVSVCIPTYNRCEMLRKTIGSVLQQSFTSVEIIVVDNASTDGTSVVVGDFIQKGAPIKYQKNQENIGAVKNFTKAMSLATCEYCMWLADDDWLDQDYIEKCLFELEANRELVLVAGKCHYFDRGAPTRLAINTNLLSGSRILRLLNYYVSVGDNSIFYGLYRRSAIKGVAFKNILGSDWIFVAAMAFRGKLKTIQSTHLNREERGSSTDLTKLAIELGYSRSLSTEPYLVVCMEAFKDIVNEDVVYGRLSVPARYFLAAFVFGIIFVKKVILQRIYRLMRGLKHYVHIYLKKLR